MTFDLIDQPWIPVTRRGERQEVSLLEALQQAHTIDGMSLENPLEAVAVLRQVLLPVLFAAGGLPRTEDEWVDRWEEGTLGDEKITEYLSRRRDRFDLFHPERPFAQVAGLRTERDETKPSSLLIASVAAGNNVPLFSPRTEAQPPALTPAQAARALLAAHCWDTAAIKSGAVGDPKMKAGKTTGNPTGPLGRLGVVIPLGATLAQTLLLNTPVSPQGLRREDRPHWDGDAQTPRWEERPVLGLLDLLTWQSRRVRLIPGSDGRIRQVVLAAGDRMSEIPADVEPHAAWRRAEKPKAGQPAQTPVRHRSDRAAWRGLPGLLAVREPVDGVDAPALIRQLADLRADNRVPATLQVQALTVGVAYGNQSAVVEDLLADTVPLPVAALTDDSEVRRLVLDVVQQADDLRKAANDLDDDIRRAAGGDALPWDRSQRLGERLIHALAVDVQRLLRGLQHHPDQAEGARQAWRAQARTRALDALEIAIEAAPPSAFLGRQRDRSVHRVARAEHSFRVKVNSTLGKLDRREPAA